MSGVLDRMVQRSRGQLPTIQPLLRAQQTEAAALPSMVEEVAAAAARGRDAASAGRERALREELAAPVRDNLRRDVAQTSEQTRKGLRGSDALDVDRVGGTAERGGAPATKGADEDGLKSARLERPVELHEAAQESTESHELPREMLAEKIRAGAKAEETAGGKIRSKTETGRSAEKQDTFSGWNETREAAAAEEHTEIHITIGSVELRAPRVAPVPPKTPAFRPRVTLDEFLKRGSGSGGWGAKS